MTKSLSRRTQNALTILNTKEHIASVLLTELGTESISKAAIYELAMRHIKVTRGLVLDEDTLDDVIEYLLVIGSRTYMTSASEINRFLDIKKQLSGSGKKKESVEKLRNLYLESIAGYKPQEHESSFPARKLDSIIWDLNRVIHNDITELWHDGYEENKVLEISSIPPPALKAAESILAAFPLVQRADINSYEDLVNIIEADSLMQYLDKEYRRQIRERIEDRVASIAEGHETEKLSTHHILWETKIGFLATKGIMPIASTKSMKHFKETDCESALLSVVSETKHPHYDFDRDYLLNEDQSLFFLRVSNNSEEVRKGLEFENYKRQNKKIVTYKEFHSEASNFLKSSPYECSMTERALLLRCLNLVFEGDKNDPESWKSLYFMEKAGVEGIDQIAYCIASYVSGLRYHGGKVHKGGENLTMDYFYGPEGNEAIRLNMQYLPWKILSAYVNNQILTSLSDMNKNEFFASASWSSPVRFNVEYSPEDLAITRYLMSKYPVFSVVPARTRMDLTNGIMLTMLDSLTNDHSVDTDASITQNLMVKYLNALGEIKVKQG
jgi:hypothetical protein